MVNHDQKNDSKIYHEIMPSLDQKIPYNRHEINSSKQVKFQYFFSNGCANNLRHILISV